MRVLEGIVELAPVYGERGLSIVSGLGKFVWDAEGRRYLDFHTGHGAAFLGHKNPEVISRLREVLDSGVIAVGAAFSSPWREEAAKALSRITPGRWVMYMLNTGTEAVELALKIAVKATGRSKIVAFKGGFHGRTLGSLSATWNPAYRGPFTRHGYPVAFAPYNDPYSLDKYVDEDTAAIIVETVQGEGGIIPGSREFLHAVRKEASRAGALFVVDEVQTGFGRTGCTWSWECLGVEPDIFTAGKSIGGGFPVSVVMVKPEFNALSKSEYGSTHGGNPLASAAIVGGVEALIKDDVPSKAARMGRVFEEVLRERLEGHRLIREIRVKGLMVGVELRRPPTPYLKCLQSRRILALKAGATVVRFLPPYLIDEDDVGGAVESLEACLSA
ncbi:MAG: aspartate aminotransferase family protein [Desulfurococcales archaeon]|nr:aspartate aminotransferase family protein [Desulfurococcales archaeon]